jgi:hypothetical protein
MADYDQMQVRSSERWAVVAFLTSLPIAGRIYPKESLPVSNTRQMYQRQRLYCAGRRMRVPRPAVGTGGHRAGRITHHRTSPDQ